MAAKIPYDPGKPSIARVYDHWLGGKDNFAVDRAFADELAKVLPDIYTIVRANREFLGNVVRHLVRDRGITQFLDLGAGLPTADNVHQVAQAHDPGARVVYVDNDAEVLAHGRALLAGDQQTGVVIADLRDPDTVWGDRVTTSLLDLDRPVAVMFISILHFIGDQDDPYTLIKSYLERVPSGSFLAISTARANPAGDAIEGMYRDKLADRGGGGAVSRSEADILRFFDGLELQPPGLVPVTRWRPDGRSAPAKDVPFVAALGRKP